MPDVDIDFDERRRGEVIRYVAGEVRRGQGQPDRHLRHDQGQGRDQGLRPGARLPVRGGRPAHQGDAAGVMGKDIPLSGIFDPTHPRYNEAGEIRGLLRVRPGRRARSSTTRARARGPDPADGRARRRRHHGRRAADRQHPDDAPGRRRRDHHAVRLPDLRDARPAEDGLPGPAQPDHHRRRAAQHRAHHGKERSTSTSSAGPRRQGHLRAAGPRRHPRRLPARRRPDAVAAAADEARTTSRTSPPSSRSTGPARWARTRTPTTRCARTASRRSRRSTRSWRSRCEEILGQTYGLIVYQEQVHGDAQIVAGYSLGQADLLRRAMGKKKKEILDKEFVAVPRPACRSNGYSDEAIKTLWDILVPFADYAFNKAHSAAYGLVSYWTAYLKANYPAEYMAGAAHLRRRRQGQDGRSTWPSAAGWASRCCRRTSTTSVRDVHRRSATTSASAWPRCATSAHNVVDSIIRCPRGEGRVHRLLRLPVARSTRWPATRRSSNR